MTGVVICGTCGCVVTLEQAAERRWGVMFGQPQCSLACAEVLYEPRYAADRFRPAGPDLPEVLAPWLYLRAAPVAQPPPQDA